jgi:hypothetical protein
LGKGVIFQHEWGAWEDPASLGPREKDVEYENRDDEADHPIIVRLQRQSRGDERQVCPARTAWIEGSLRLMLEGADNQQ